MSKGIGGLTTLLLMCAFVYYKYVLIATVIGVIGVFLYLKASN